MAVADDKIKVAFLKKVILDSRHDRSGITFADFGNQNADGITALLTEGTGEVIGAIVEFAGGLADQLLSVRRNRFRVGRTIHDEGDRGLREAQMLSQRFETDGLSGWL